jgi:hypothetical protein
VKKTAALLAVLLTIGCAAVTPPAPIPAVSAPDNSERQILVTFVDRALSRAPSGSPGGYLRRGAEYGTTTWSHGIGETIAARHHLRTVTEWPILTLGVHCVVYAVDDGRAIPEVIAALQKDKNVASAQAMGIFHVLSADPYENLQRSIRSMNVDRVHRWSIGRGVVIGIVDTGVDLDHPDLDGQIALHTDLARPPAGQPFENDIHGTAVAGVIAALAGNGQGITGVAPGAELRVYRACWPLRGSEPQAICNSLSLATALDAAIRGGPRIINLSLTGPPDPLVGALLSAALARRILVVVAEPPESQDEPDFVDGLDSVIRVRAAGGMAGGAQANRGVIAAPGIDVLTTFPHGTYNFISGSSFAAANVTGVIALLLEVRPEMRLGAVRSALDAGMIRDPSLGEGDGIDACAALEQLNAVERCSR